MQSNSNSYPLNGSETVLVTLQNWARAMLGKPSGNKHATVVAEGTVFSRRTPYAHVCLAEAMWNPNLSTQTTSAAINNFLRLKARILSADTVLAKSDVPLKYVVASSDTANPFISFSFSKLPSWLTASGDSVTGVPPKNSGDTCFSIVITDMVYSDTMVVFINMERSSGTEFSLLKSDVPVLSVSPNPFSFSTCIRVSGTDIQNLRVSILNIEGRKVAEFGQDKKKIRWNTAGLTGGVYFIHAENRNGRKLTAKVLLLK
jgi:hypothetical protein